jgi:hypothetical protein
VASAARGIHSARPGKMDEMAVFDEVISQPPLSWAFGFGDRADDPDGDGERVDEICADHAAGANGHADAQPDR